jgi:hypothetical protein
MRRRRWEEREEWAVSGMVIGGAAVGWGGMGARDGGGARRRGGRRGARGGKKGVEAAGRGVIVAASEEELEMRHRGSSGDDSGGAGEGEETEVESTRAAGSMSLWRAWARARQRSMCARMWTCVLAAAAEREEGDQFRVADRRPDGSADGVELGTRWLQRGAFRVFSTILLKIEV